MKLENIDRVSPDIWQQAREIVDAIPRKRYVRDRSTWWMDDLEHMRDDTRRL